MKGLVSYALERGIDIVPEIDMPGHFSAAIKVYPELSCTGEAGWGEEFSYPICPSRPENYQFVQSIIDEMVEIFPSEYSISEQMKWRKITGNSVKFVSD